MRSSSSKTPPPSDPEAGVWHGKRVARRFVSPDGLTILVGRTARDNDVLTFKIAGARDFWLHAAGTSGAHVVVRNPDDLARLPRDTLQYAAALAAGYSGARGTGRLSVHVAMREDVRKPRGVPDGTVTLRRFTAVRAAPLRPPTAAADTDPHG
jgi:predicted ribosome quality control (RQC) complex YloA/Tae2 family protein